LIALRRVEPADLSILYEHQRDPVAIELADDLPDGLEFVLA
jgi:hypothetical protein